MPSILSQAVMGRERSPRRPTDGQRELAPQIPTLGKVLDKESRAMRDSPAGHSQPAWPVAWPLLPLGFLRVLSSQVGSVGEQESGRAEVRLTRFQIAPP